MSKKIQELKIVFGSKNVVNVPDNDRFVIAASIEFALMDGHTVDGVVGTTKHSAALSTEHLPHTNITITTGSEHWKQAEEHSTLVTCLEQAVALDLYRSLVHHVLVCTTLHLDHSTLTDVLKSEGRQP